MNLPSALSPAYAVAGTAVVAVAATVAARAVPFYRRAVAVEAASRLTGLDGLRGLLCFGVLFHHAAVTRGYLRGGVWAEPPSTFYTMTGVVAVDLFFCLTGFLFWTRVLATGGRLEPAAFLRSRWFRVVPLHAFAGAVGLAVFAPRVRWLSAETAQGLAGLASMGLHPWGGFGGRDGTVVNIGQVDAFVTRTLPDEWAFYLALPALAACVRAGQGKRLLLAAGGLWLLVGQGWHLYFGAGIVAAHVARHPRAAAALRHPAAAALPLACLAVAGGVPNDWARLAATTVGFLPLACGNTLLGLLDLPGLRVMGIVSYSVYLLHGIGLYVARPVLNRWTGDGHGPAFWAAATGLAVGVLGVCLLTFRWVEYPAIAYEKRGRREAPTDRVVREAVG